MKMEANVTNISKLNNINEGTIANIAITNITWKCQIYIQSALILILRKAGKRLISYTVFNSDDTLMLNNLIWEIWTYSSVMLSIQKKKTNQFSYNIGHLIGDKVRFN